MQWTVSDYVSYYTSGSLWGIVGRIVNQTDKDIDLGEMVFLWQKTTGKNADT